MFPNFRQRRFYINFFIGLGTLFLFACNPVAPQAKAIKNIELTPSLSISPTTSSSPSPFPSPSPSLTLHPPTLTPSSTATVLPTATPSPTIPVETRLLFTGVIVPARCVQAALDAKGNPNYPYEEVRQVITDADLAIGTFNATMSEYAPRRGCVRTYVLVGDPDNADALQWAGFDVMSVATNHIKDCGVADCADRAFFDTLENLKRVGILTVGAGKNHAEAMQPVVVTVHGIRFGFISLGQINARVFAGPDQAGIAILNEENIKEAIASARAVADVVIAIPHWGPEDSAVPNWIQRGLAQQLVAAGADLVVGNHTHVVQAIQEINSVPVFYGLGNFVFDQGLTAQRQGVILVVKFSGTEYVDYELIPTHVDKDGHVHIAGEKEAKQILERIDLASQAIR